jgi:hypothetical protein
MGFLDRAKKLAEQAKDAAEQAKKAAEQATGRAIGSVAPTTSSNSPPSADSASSGRGWVGPGTARDSSSPQFGTPYQPGMLGRPGWRERGLTDPAALLPIRERDRAGVPHTTKSQILEEPYGMGRRWTSGDRSAGLYYQLYPEHRSWQPPVPKTPVSSVPGASEAALPDGRKLLFLGGQGGSEAVVLEVAGLDSSAVGDLALTVAGNLANR